jgi:hypothetical protein
MWWTNLDSDRGELVRGVLDLLERYGKTLEQTVEESRNLSDVQPPPA